MSLWVLATVVLCQASAGVPDAFAATTTTGAASRKSFGTVTGTVRDSSGNPLSGALVTLLRDGANQVIRETRSAADGSFVTRVAPGRYLLRAVAEGFTPATFTAVQISPSAELVYRFNLEPAGQGRTASEQRPDRNDPKFRYRASQSRRSIFQAEGVEDAVIDAVEVAMEQAEGVEETSRGEAEASTHGRTQGVVETYYTAATDTNAGGAGLNFAFASPVRSNLDFIFAGQFGTLNRLETTARLRAGARHRVSATVSGAQLRLAPQMSQPTDTTLGQFSTRAVDEWIVRDGVVVVLGLDYSRFLGASQADSFSPRFGIQFDANARTRVRAAYAPGGDESSAQSVAVFEDAPVVFREQRNTPLALVDGRAVMERSRRLEFGVERVLDDHSSIEATAFFDTTDGRGVGLFATSASAFSDENGALLSRIANQQGAARGVRVVYKRRIGSNVTASAGYSFGRGQQLSSEGFDNPEAVFSNGFFQTAAAQVDADLLDGMRVRTVLRFSPRAAVFAIDPFAGRLAVYDPSLSILVSQELPNFGLPFSAEAVLDARNLLDVLSSIEDGESILTVNAARRMVRGGISVRF
jgi:hypothetical protein